MPFEKILQNELLWCLSCIEYQHSNEGYENYISLLSKGILNNSNFIQCIKTKTFEWILTNCKNWQCEVALNRKNYSSKFTCFSLALRNYVIIIIKQTISKILYSLEKLSAMSTFFNSENCESKVKKELSELWKKFFMDNTIINIDNLCEPKPSMYIMSRSINDLEFPFSYYFMNLINYYEKYYFEELDILRQDSENINNESYADHIEDFKNNLISIHPYFEYLQRYSEFYYNDFISIILSTYSIKLPSKENLDFILRNLIEVTEDKIIDPFILHIYWWKYSNEILIQLKLVETFPNIVLKVQNDFVVHGKLAQDLFRESINSILQNICDDKPWKQDMDYILSILSVTEVIDDDSGKFSNLIICNDLLKINSIPLEKIKEIIYLGKSGKKQEFITAEIINLVFNSLDDNNNDITPIISFISFITRNLKLIPLESDVRKLEFNELSPYFKYAIESFVQEDLLLQQIFILQQITSIAFLKEFINQFWKKYFSLSSSMIKEINDIMKINNDNPFIQSIRSYFALELNSFDYIKQHEIIKEEFTWLDDCKDKKITYLSKLFKPIKRINFELMKHLYPIIRFVKILSFKLEHRLTKKEAQNMTFHEFIKKESAD
ncbi:unnamed protein product [Rhizophagus irregularis]|nr:unnamed protein product [Rhizophagus irregularis]